MSASTPEGKVKAKIDAILKRYTTRGELWYSKTAGSMFGKNGVPDYIGCAKLHYAVGLRDRERVVSNAMFFAIEAKAGKGKVSELQAVQLDLIERAGGICFVLNENNLDELERWLRNVT